MHKRCDELTVMTTKQLLEIAKELNITGRHSMKKQVLIDSIILAEDIVRNISLARKSDNAALEELLAKDVEAEWGNEDASQKDSYIDNAKIGMLIAFKVNDRKALSGMIDEIHQGGFVVKTKNGVRFNVRRKNVMWVKTGSRWPKGVYQALKGVTPNGAYQAAN